MTLKTANMNGIKGRSLTTIFLIACTAVLFSCINLNTHHDDIMCTEEYRMITVRVTDSLFNPVMLTRYRTIKVSSGDTLNFQGEDPYMDSINQKNGYYTLMTDGKMYLTSTSGTEFKFVGWVGEKQVVNENYIIGNDQCHVQFFSGRREIVIAGK